MSDQRTHSPQEIADRTGKNIHTIYRHLRSGKLPGDKFGGEWIVTEEHVKEWLPAPLYEKYFAEDNR
jgi:excisionase family DNA binding protein